MIQSWTMARFLRDKHDRSSRQLGLRKSLIVTVYHVSYEARNYDSVGREICLKTAVCFDQSNLLSLRRVRILPVGTEQKQSSEKSKQYHAINPLSDFKLCKGLTFTVG